ncbi:hypothetical protein IU486_13235 [Streptomyces gardneri]|uniref:hypothetical protein n=1 Tax=Nocardia TaxID=1817 RepID=UPI00135BFAC1|nr:MULTISPECIES: hypothetical protein [Nocardia]MBF6165735.1 hypothetical protein [Streptomyces gardneri]MBF6203059.1 hypothetical protein [Streptomyces gardneri]UAK35783.1 hypothetical protein K8O92_18260 [Nocardia asteroides]
MPSDRHESRLAALDRRSALRLAGGGTVGVLALGALAGCTGDDVVHEPDPLAAQEIAARADAAAATAAIAIAPDRHAALTAIAAERTAHADALRTEIDRVIGVYADGTKPAHRTRAGGSGPSAVASGSAVPPTAPPTVEALRAQLAESRRAAADLARALSGYRAGLLASISAACAVQAGVLLA